MSIKNARTIVTVLLLSIPSVSSRSSQAWQQMEGPSSVSALPGLQDPVRLVRDGFGVPHVYARNDHDAFFMMGYTHAQDRFFQMDTTRRQASGTLAELLGPGPGNQVLAGDVQLRTLGLRRAALRSRAAYSSEAIAVLQAYADGVNAFLDTSPLPPEYAALELTKAGVPRWTIDDSITIVKLLAFGLSFDSGDLSNTTTLGAYRAAGQAAGFDGTRLFFEDLFRSAPFAPTVSIPEQQAGEILTTAARPAAGGSKTRPQELIQPPAMASIRRFLEATADNPMFSGPRTEFGSNWFVVSGRRTDTGFPMLANDPHLSLTSPSVFFEAHLVVSGPDQAPLNVYGVSFPGAPTFPHGFNERIAWGSTVNPLDVTDFYQERVITDSAGRPVATFFRGAAEPLLPIPETFRVNVIGDMIPDGTVVVTSGVPPATLVVPRRNNGPLVTAPAGSPLTAISVQYSGFSPTRELDTFLIFARARNLDDFRRGLQFFDVGSQNWSYVDTDGNIAYFTSAELPLREDLQAGTVDGGIPPFFVRDGTGTLRHEWLRNDNPPPDQALRFEILPFDEMPQIVNPRKGYIVNANNDPAGTSLDNDPLNQLRRSGQGILYLSPGYAIGNRAARIEALIRRKLGASHEGEGDDGNHHQHDNERNSDDDDEDRDEHGAISFEDLARIQADVQLFDAEVLTPHILGAFEHARRRSAPAPLAEIADDRAIAEAVGRLGRWDFTTPTGIPEGQDGADVHGNRRAPRSKEIANSVAATIYSLWRGQILRNTIDVTLGRVGLGGVLPGGDRSMVALRNLLDTFPTSHGRGASGLDFFDAPDTVLDPEVERDIILLRSLKDALNLLAGPVFAPAFGGSTDQDDYRWGKLHRIVFRHPLNTAPFNIPPGAGFTDLAPLLPGVATDGGFDVVDASSHNPRAASLNGFMFGSGPSRRFIGEARRSRVRAVQVIPGGESGVPGSPFFGNMLGLWLKNDFHDALFSRRQVLSNAFSTEDFLPQ